MSTRATIILKDEYDSQYFYRHSDGYPEGALPPLRIFMQWVQSGAIRRNVMQSAGWIVILGAIEYNTIPQFAVKDGPRDGYGKLESITPPKDWKSSSMEPCSNESGESYTYTLDLQNMTLSYDDDENGHMVEDYQRDPDCREL